MLNVCRLIFFGAEAHDKSEIQKRQPTLLQLGERAGHVRLELGGVCFSWPSGILTGVVAIGSLESK